MMNLRTLDRFFPPDGWHILPTAFENLLLTVLQQEREEPQRQVKAWSTGNSSSYRDELERTVEARPKVDYWGDEIAQMTVTESGLAIVPIHGPLMKGARGSDKYYFGVISHEDVEADLDNAQAQGAHTILLDINSPGGTVAGTPELAAKIDELGGSPDLNVVSFNRGLSASAAEYLSAGASLRFATESSINGSIGTILQTVDLSKMLEQFGVTVHTFTSGKYKGTGNPYQAMTDDQKDYLKGMVKQLGAQFAAHMQSHRPSMQPEHFQGQTFTAKEARIIGLTDETVRTRAEVLAAIL